MANEKTKPLILALNEAENELAACVNAILHEKQIPCYLLEQVFDKLHRQLKDGAMKELSKASAMYASAIQESKEADERVS